MPLTILRNDITKMNCDAVESAAKIGIDRSRAVDYYATPKETADIVLYGKRCHNIQKKSQGSFKRGMEDRFKKE